MITIIYFGVLKAELNCASEEIPWQTGDDVQYLLETLRARGEPWQETLRPERIFKIAIDEELIHDNAAIPCGAKVAILPPVTGG